MTETTGPGSGAHLVLWLHGLLVDEAIRADFVPVNNADDWLHLGLGLGMTALAPALKGNPDARSA